MGKGRRSIVNTTKPNKPIDSPSGSVSKEISFNNLDDDGPSTSSASQYQR